MKKRAYGLGRELVFWLAAAVTAAGALLLIALILADFYFGIEGFRVP